MTGPMIAFTILAKLCSDARGAALIYVTLALPVFLGLGLLAVTQRNIQDVLGDRELVHRRQQLSGDAP